MEIIIEALKNIDAGTFVLWIIAIIGVISGIVTLAKKGYKGLEKYRSVKNESDEKQELLKKHDKQLVEINQRIDTIMNGITAIKDQNQVLSSMILEVEQNNTRQNEEIKQENYISEMRRIRWEIIDFSNSCRTGRKHTRDAFSHIFDNIEEYHKLLKLTGSNNGFIDAEVENIKNMYVSSKPEDILI